MHKVKFVNNPKPFNVSLNDKINSYFETNNIDMKGNWKLYHKTVVLYLLMFGAYASLFIIQPVSWIHIVITIIMSLCMSSIGFNVMHDAAHGSYSHNKKLNQFITFIAGDLIGGSTFLWKIKHNIIHHTYTNIEGIDDDIAKYPLFRMTETQDLKWWHKYQFLYSLPLYSITSIYWFFVDDYAKIFTKKINTTDVTTMDKKAIINLLFGKLLNLIMFVIVPLVYFGWANFLIGFFALHLTMGLTLAIVFQMAHIVEELEFPVPDANSQKIENEWAIHQVKTTANFAMNNKFISWFVGGLNYQIEHHLYPKISHIHYPAISKFVQQTCDEFGIEYHSFPTFRRAIASHFKVLWNRGRVAA